MPKILNKQNVKYIRKATPHDFTLEFIIGDSRKLKTKGDDVSGWESGEFVGAKMGRIVATIKRRNDRKSTKPRSWYIFTMVTIGWLRSNRDIVNNLTVAARFSRNHDTCLSVPVSTLFSKLFSWLKVFVGNEKKISRDWFEVTELFKRFYRIDDVKFRDIVSRESRRRLKCNRRISENKCNLLL